jgi:hypothetical protein
MNGIMPTIGRIVLFRDKSYTDIYGLPEYPAIVTRVWDTNVINLTIFIDGLSPKFESSVVYNEQVSDSDAHCWRWPPHF